MKEIPVLFALVMGAFYIVTMKKMAVFQPSLSNQSKHILIKVLGGLCLLVGIVLWGLYFSNTRQSNADLLITIDFFCIVFGWATYCFFFKKSNSGVGKKTLKVTYAIVLTVAYLGSYTNLLFMIMYGIIASLVYGKYSFPKRDNAERDSSNVDFNSLQKNVVKEASPYNEIWKQEIKNKSYDDLIMILSNPQHYNVEFIKMAWFHLQTFENFEEHEVKAKIEEFREQAAIPKVKDNRCPYCGKKIRDRTAEFCRYCGKPLVYN